MDLQQLKIFLNAAALKSFSRAAEQMYISQPSVSARIKALEEELDAILFDRSHPRELALTAEGILFMDYAQKMLNLHEAALAELAPGTRRLAGTVRMAASTVPGIYLLPPLLARFRECCPGVTLNLAIMDSAAVVEKILDYNVELGLIGEEAAEERLESAVFAEDELVLITPPGLLDQKVIKEDSSGRGIVDLASCFPYPLLLREEGSATRRFFERALLKTDMRFSDFAGIIYMDNLEVIKQSVRYGLGISLVSKLSADDYFKAGLISVYQPAGLNLARRIYLLRHHRRVLSRAADMLYKFILEYSAASAST
jgi:DNA-binding transcriptional LysR family regulator